MNKFKRLLEEHGEYKFNGIILALTQQPYVDRDEYGDTVYRANAIDEDENECLIIWELCISEEEFKELEDESTACHWDKYTVSIY